MGQGDLQISHLLYDIRKRIDTIRFTEHLGFQNIKDLECPGADHYAWMSDQFLKRVGMGFPHLSIHNYSLLLRCGDVAVAVWLCFIKSRLSRQLEKVDNLLLNNKEPPFPRAPRS